MDLITRVINWIRTNKKTSLLIFSFIFFLGFLYIVFGRGGNKPVATETPTPTATPNRILSNLPALGLPTIEPSPGSVEMADTEAAISLFFSTPIDVNTVLVSSNPNINFKISVLADFPNRIILTPQVPWQSGVDYTITIAAGLLSSDGKKQLKQDVVIKYSVLAIPPLNKIE